MLPKSVTKIGDYAFEKCPNLQLHLTQNQFENALPSGGSVLAHVLTPEGTTYRVIAAYKWYKEVLSNLMPSSIAQYDVLVATGSYDGFKMTLPQRIRAALWRLVDKELPVSDQVRGEFAALLTSKITQAMKCADEDRDPSYIKTLLEIGAINEENKKKAKKALAASSVPEIQAMADNLSVAVPAPQEAKEISPAEQMVDSYMAKEEATEQTLRQKLKDFFGLTYLDLPELLDKNGTVLPSKVLAWLLLEHDQFKFDRWWSKYELRKNLRPGFGKDAATAIEQLDAGSFQAAIQNLANDRLHPGALGKAANIAFPICRYASEETMAMLVKIAPSWRTVRSGNDASPLLEFRMGCVCSTTRTAMLFADKFGDLGIYAAARGIREQKLRDKMLSKSDLDENGQVTYDLGNTTVTVTLDQDLNLSLYNNGAGKAVKSIPKRGADPERYDAVQAAFKTLKKTIQDMVKSRKITCERHSSPAKPLPARRGSWPI